MVPALIAAVSALIVVNITQFYASRNLRNQWERAREDEHQRWERDRRAEAYSDFLASHLRVVREVSELATETAPWADPFRPARGSDKKWREEQWGRVRAALDTFVQAHSKVMILSSRSVCDVSAHMLSPVHELKRLAYARLGKDDGGAGSEDAEYVRIRDLGIVAMQEFLDSVRAEFEAPTVAPANASALA